MKTPDVTPAQIAVALAAIVSACVVLFKLNISDAEQAQLVIGLTAVIGVSWKIADAIIRHGRAGVVAAQHQQAAAEITAAAATAHLDQGDVPGMMAPVPGASSPPATS